MRQQAMTHRCSTGFCCCVGSWLSPNVLHMRVVQPDAGVKDTHLHASASEPRVPQLLGIERPCAIGRQACTSNDQASDDQLCKTLAAEPML